jgi:ferritin-like metal-binding protein YciE
MGKNMADYKNNQKLLEETVKVDMKNFKDMNEIKKHRYKENQITGQIRQAMFRRQQLENLLQEIEKHLSKTKGLV